MTVTWEDVREAEKEKGPQPGMWIALGCIFAFGFIAITIANRLFPDQAKKEAFPQRKTAIQEPRERRAANPRWDAPGRTVVLEHGSSKGLVPVATSQQSYYRLEELSVAKDIEGIKQMMLRGEVLNIPAGTKALMIERGLTNHEVRILEGVYEGESVFVASHLISA